MAEADPAVPQQPAGKHGPVFLRNIVANAAGRGWSMLMNFAFVPLYIRLLGIEAYGVIAFFATLSALFAFLDLGLSSTLNREIARRTGSGDVAGSSQDVVRTLEIIYWGIGLAVSAIIILAAPLIAVRWLDTRTVSAETLTNAIRLMGVVIALHWPSGLYSGGLAGLQKQVTANTLDILFSTARGAGAVLVLFAVSTTIQGFFVWQAIMSGVTVLTLRTVLMRRLGPAPHPVRFNRGVLADTWRFAGGMTGLSLLSILLMYGDKVVLSAILPLSVYAQYMLANTLAAASSMLAFAVFHALYPRLTQLVAARDRAGVANAYHLGTQIIGFAVIPPALIVLLFSHEILLFWTWNGAIADTAAPIASLLVVGTMLNSVMMVPYALQLANGSTRLNLIANIVSVVVLLPATWWLARRYGPIGAALLWPAQNLGYILFLAPAVHRRFLPGASRRWYLRDLGLPLAAAAGVAVAGRLLIPHGLSPIAGFVLAGVTGAAALAAAGLATEQGLAIARGVLRRPAVAA